MENKYKLYNGDCLEVMKDIPDKSVDMILCDLPYGTTQCKWDVIIPMNDYVEIKVKKKTVNMGYVEYRNYCLFDLKMKDFDEIEEYWNKNYKIGLWSHYNRIIKDNGAIVLFAQTPFDKVLGSSNLKMLKYEWIYNKSKPTGFLNAKKMPLKKHENILIFYKKLPIYNPQGLIKDGITSIKRSNNGNYGNCSKETVREYTNYPISILNENNVFKKQLHPTQKPIELLEYLIKTYTNKGETVLDNCMGSGSTGVACLNTNRRFIGIELDEKYFNIAKERIENAENELINK